MGRNTNLKMTYQVYRLPKSSCLSVVFGLTGNTDLPKLRPKFFHGENFLDLSVAPPFYRLDLCSWKSACPLSPPFPSLLFFDNKSFSSIVCQAIGTNEKPSVASAL
jgi:hypothetical protein